MDQRDNGATACYLVGFIVAAFVIGKMAEHGQDRKLSTSLPAFLAGSLIIYGFGATWLAYDLGLPLTAAAGEPSVISLGVAPFLVGDVIKALLARAVLPADASPSPRTFAAYDVPSAERDPPGTVCRRRASPG